MKKLCVFFAVMFCFVFAANLSLHAESSGTEIQMMQNRILELENQLSEVKSLLIERTPEVASGITEDLPVVCSSYDMCLYGFAKLDFGYDTSRTNDGDNVTSVSQNTAANQDDNEFNMTAKHSRIGLKVDGPMVGDAETFARIEMDFWSGTSENAPNLRMRHAYLELKYPSWEILAGQVWEVFSSDDFISPTINFSYSAGDWGARRIPQLRLRNIFDDVFTGTLTTNISANRNYTNADIDGAGTDDGEDAGWPELQGSIKWKGELFGMQDPYTFTLSGVYGETEVDNAATGEDGNGHTVEGICFGAIIPIVDKLSFKGEAWTGQNLNHHGRGTLVNGVNLSSDQRNDYKGGWGAFTYKYNDSLKVNLGAGVEKVDIEHIVDGDMHYNANIFANFIYKLGENVSWGLEYMHMKTDYAELGSGNNLDSDNNRVAGMIMYVF